MNKKFVLGVLGVVVMIAFVGAVYADEGDLIWSRNIPLFGQAEQEYYSIIQFNVPPFAAVAVGRSDANVETSAAVTFFNASGHPIKNVIIDAEETDPYYCNDGAYDVIMIPEDNSTVIAGYARAYRSYDNMKKAWIVKTVGTTNVKEWQWIGDNYAYIKSVIRTRDGGYLGVGSSSDDQNTYIVKLNSTGNLTWKYVFNLSDKDYGTDVVETSEGGFLISCYSRDGYGNEDGCILKIDENGNHEWNKTYGSVSSNQSSLSLVKSPNGNYMFGGYTYAGPAKRGWIVKIDANGNEIDEKNYTQFKSVNSIVVSRLVYKDIVTYGIGGEAYSAGYSFIARINGDGGMRWYKENNLGGNVITRSVADINNNLVSLSSAPLSINANDNYVTKYDGIWYPLWYKTAGTDFNDEIKDIIYTSDKGYAMAGWKSNLTDSGNFLLMKVDGNGNHLWNKSFGGDEDDRAEALVQTNDNGYLLVGKSKSFGYGNNQIYVVKTDSSGNKQWDAKYGGVGDHAAYDVVKAADGYFVAGESYTEGKIKGIILKYNLSGNLIWVKTDIGSYNYNVLKSLVLNGAGNYIYAVGHSNVSNQFDCFVTRRFASDGRLDWEKYYTRSSTMETCESIIESKLGMFITAGYTGTPANADFWVLYITPTGRELSNRTYGGEYDDRAYDIVEKSNGLFVIVGKTNSFPINDFEQRNYFDEYDVWKIVIDSTGRVLSDRRYGGSSFDSAYAATKSDKDDIVMAGTTYSFSANPYSDIYLAYTNTSQDLFISDSYENSGSVAYPGDSITFYANYTNSSNDMIPNSNCLFRFDDYVAMITCTPYSGCEYTRSFEDFKNYKWSVECSSADYSTLFSEDTIKVDLIGEAGPGGEYSNRLYPIFTTTFEGRDLYNATPRDVIVNDEGDIVMFGSSNTYGSISKTPYILISGSEGEIKNQKKVYITGGLLSGIQDSDGNYVAVGYTGDITNITYKTSFYIVKLDKNLSIIKDGNPNYNPNRRRMFNDIIEMGNGNYMVVGEDRNITTGDSDAVFYELDRDTLTIVNIGSLSGSGNQVFNSVIDFGDGKYAAVGYDDGVPGKGKDVLLTVFNSTQINESYRYGDSGDDIGEDLIKFYSAIWGRDMLAIVGGTNSTENGDYDVLFYYIYLPTYLNIPPLKSLKIGGAEDDYGYSIIKGNLVGDQLVLGGYTESSGKGGKDVFMVALDTGNLNYINQTYGSISPTGDEIGYAMFSGDYIYVLASYKGEDDFWLIKLAEDWDVDNSPDGIDNCLYNHNPNQEDSDGDGIGDICDICPGQPGQDCQDPKMYTKQKLYYEWGVIVTNAAKEVSITVPSGALDNATVISMDKGTNKNFKVGDDAYAVYEYKLNNGGYDFNVPVTITFSIESLSEADKDRAAIYYSPDNGLTWEKLTPILKNSTHIVVQATHFSNYVIATEGDEGLYIWDSHEGIIAWPGETITFYAEYYNRTDETPITGAECNITFDEPEEGPFTMDYDPVIGVYNWTRSFSANGWHYWNVTCTKEGFITLRTYDIVGVFEGGQEPVIPEFSATTIVLAIIVIGLGITLIAVKKKKKK